MKRQIFAALIAGGLVFAAGAASAQSWRSLNDRQHRRDGLSRWERADLDRRLDALSARIHDSQCYGYGHHH